MANISILNRQNALKKDLRFYVEKSGMSLTLYPSRFTSNGRTTYSFLTDRISKFPRDLTQTFVDGLTTINFSTGTITGADLVSPDFTPPSVPSVDAVLATVSISVNDVISVTYGPVKSYNQILFDFANNAFPLTKTLVPLYGVLIHNGTIESLADLRPDFSSTVFKTDDILFPDNTQAFFKMGEYLIQDANIGDAFVQIRGTLLSVGNSVTISSSAGSENKTVVGVFREGRDEIQTITFSAVPVTGSFVINHNGNNTSAIPFDATASDVQTALRALSSLTDIQVTGDFVSGFVLNFVRGDGKLAQPQVTVPINTLGVTATVTTTQDGFGPTAEPRVYFDSNLTLAHTVAGNARVKINNYATFSEAQNSRSNILYDTGWTACSVGNLINITHNLGMNVFSYSWIVYFNSVAGMDGAKQVFTYADNGLTNTYGCQVRLNFNTAHFRFGGSAIVHNLDNTGNLFSSPSSGFFRAIAVAH